MRAERLTDLPAHDDSCPFCKGNERETPGSMLVNHYPDSEQWSLRVVPNKYPAVSMKPRSLDWHQHLLKRISETLFDGLVNHDLRERVDAVG